MIGIVCAALFLVALFAYKNGLIFRNETPIQKLNRESGLIYGGTVADLVGNDADGDGIVDWEEALWGLDPTQKETTPGVPDSTTFAKLKASYEIEGSGPYDNENLTQTDKFSRELFATLAALNQAGTMDESSIEKITASLAEKIQNPDQKKVYTSTDIKMVPDNSVTAVKKYHDALNYIIETKYPITGNVLEILKRFLVDENNVDSSVLVELTPIIQQRNKIIDAMVKTEVPQSLAPLHLNLINALQQFSEMLSTLQLFDTDPIVTLGAISKLEENFATMESASNKLRDAIQAKLNN